MIGIADRRFNSELRPTQNLPFLASCIGEKITVEIDFYYENICFANEDVLIRFIPASEYVGTLDNQSMIWIEGDNFFDRCKVGETIKVKNTTTSFVNDGDYVIAEIISGNIARMTTDFTTGSAIDKSSGGIFGGPHNAGYVANITPLKGVKYDYNIIDSGSTYLSLIDGERQGAQTDDADATVLTELAMTFIGEKSYQIGSIKIKGRGTGQEQQKFTIVHETVVTPFFLAAQFEDLLLRKKPSYYESSKCLNYISSIQLGKSLNDPNGLTVLDVGNAKSNTGWFNENFNGKPSKYFVDSLVLSNASGPVDALMFEEVTITATISNPDLPFDPVTTKCVFGFNYLPEDQSLYDKNGYDQERNFLFDSKMVTIGVAATNGDNFGTGMQVIKSVELDYVDTGHVTLTAKIEFGNDAEDIIRQGDFKRYMFWVIMDDLSLSADKSDKVNLLLQVAEVYEQLTTVDLIDAETVFIEHPYLDPAFGKETLEMFPVDDVVANTDFSIDYTGLESNGIKIKAIKPSIRLKHATNADVILESFTVNTGNFPEIGSLPSVQNIDFSQDRVFKREDGIHKTIRAKRDFVNDSGLVYNWDFSYPFMNRWEYWINLENILNIPSSIFDITKPNNGINNFWDRLANLTGWTLEYQLEFEIEQNGLLFSQEFSYPLQSQDFESNPEWINNSIKSYDLDTNTEIVNGSVKYIHGYKDTKIVATFEKLSGPFPDIEQIAMVLLIEPFEGLGIGDIRMISSEYTLINASWFRNDSTNLLSLSRDGAVYTGTAYIDSKKLPQNKKFTIYARIYEVEGIVPSFYRITNNEEIRELQNDDLRIY